MATEPNRFIIETKNRATDQIRATAAEMQGILGDVGDFAGHV